jgi:hypothetical protein
MLASLLRGTSSCTDATHTCRQGAVVQYKEYSRHTHEHEQGYLVPHHTQAASTHNNHWPSQERLVSKQPITSGHRHHSRHSKICQHIPQSSLDYPLHHISHQVRRRHPVRDCPCCLPTYIHGMYSCKANHNPHHTMHNSVGLLPQRRRSRHRAHATTSQRTAGY